MIKNNAQRKPLKVCFEFQCFCLTLRLPVNNSFDKLKLCFTVFDYVVKVSSSIYLLKSLLIGAIIFIALHMPMKKPQFFISTKNLKRYLYYPVETPLKYLFPYFQLWLCFWLDLPKYLWKIGYVIIGGPSFCTTIY